MGRRGIVIDGGEAGSEEEFERALKSANTGGIVRLDDGEYRTVRFVHEPYRREDIPGWYRFRQHFTDEFKAFPCLGAENDCPGCQEGDRGSMRWLAAALDVTENKMVIIQLPQMLAQSLQKRYKRHGTLLDRDYELSRDKGAGDRVVYESQAQAPVKRSISKYQAKIPDLLELLLKSTHEDFRELIGFELEDSEEKVERAKKKGVAKKVARRPARRVVDDDDEDDDDDDEEEEEDDEDEDDDVPATRRRTKKVATKKVARRPVRRR